MNGRADPRWSRPAAEIERRGSLPAVPSLRSRRLSLAAQIAASACLVWAAFTGIEELRRPLLGAPGWLVTTLASALLMGSAILAGLGRRGPLGLFVAGVALIGWPLARATPAVPTATLAAALWSVLVLLRLSRSPRPVPFARRLERVEAPLQQWSRALLLWSTIALALAAAAAGHGWVDSGPRGWIVVLMLLVPSTLLLALRWPLSHSLWPRLLMTLLSAATLGGGLLAATGRGHVAVALLAFPTTAAAITAARAHERYEDVVELLWSRPALLVVSTFVSLALLGGVLLTFPVCHVRPISDLDALFTAVSATCVTGLIVVDTATDFTIAGQVVILALIQIGALGIMTLSAAGVMLLRGSFDSLKEGSLGEIIGTSTARSTHRLIRVVTLATFTIEAAGAIALYPAFALTGDSAGDALWKALFHSVSAFCNAGFALQSDSLAAYHDTPYVLHVVSLLILAGGLGFVVIVALWELLLRRRARLTLQGRLVLVTTAVLLLTGWLAILVLEWNGALAGESTASKFHNAWLHSVTLRTAGFNSIDMSLFHPATVLGMMVWMTIGASPCSTGGGIKTTTAAVVFLSIRAVVSQSGDVHVFGRRISVPIVYRAAAVSFISLGFIVIGTTLLLITQSLPLQRALFEAVSAFGTVGLSLGVTPTLDAFGKLVVMGLMLAGRTGPLTIVLLFMQQSTPRLRYPEEEVMVG